MSSTLGIHKKEALTECLSSMHWEAFRVVSMVRRLARDKPLYTLPPNFSVHLLSRGGGVEIGWGLVDEILYCQRKYVSIPNCSSNG